MLRFSRRGQARSLRDSWCTLELKRGVPDPAGNYPPGNRFTTIVGTSNSSLSMYATSPPGPNASGMRMPSAAIVVDVAAQEARLEFVTGIAHEASVRVVHYEGLVAHIQDGDATVR